MVGRHANVLIYKLFCLQFTGSQLCVDDGMNILFVKRFIPFIVRIMQDVLGTAMHDYYFKNHPQKLWIHNNYGEPEEMPVRIYFRNENRMPKLEQMALQLCKGTVLDVGAGVGSHALALQGKGYEVTAIDISAKAVEVMKLRGVKTAINGDVFCYQNNQFGTILLMMNGIGFTGNTTKLRLFLLHAKTLINKGGQLLFDSSDVAYLYDYKLPQRETYYGEISYQYDYKNERTDWFTWLYIDRYLLAEIAEEAGWKTEVLGEDNWDRFLVRLTLK